MFVTFQTTLSGPASVHPTTICEVLKYVVKQFPFKAALCVKRNGEWVTWTWKDYYDDITAIAKSLIRVGLEPYHGVCVLGFNAPEWFISFMGGIMVSVQLKSDTFDITTWKTCFLGMLCGLLLELGIWWATDFLLRNLSLSLYP